MPIIQSSYSQRPGVALLGQLTDAFSPRQVRSKIARGKVKAGYGVFRVETVGAAGSEMVDPGEVFHIPDPSGAADVDAIITAITSSTDIQTFAVADLDGVVGDAEMQPARKVTLVLSNHADWDATNATLTGYDHNGLAVSETLAIPNGGNDTVTSTNRFRKVTGLTIPAQSGTGGTATVGISAITTLAITDFEGVAIRQPVKTALNATGIHGYPGETSTLVTANYVDGEPVPVLTSGGIWVYSEEAVADGDPVYCRITVTGTQVIGAFRNDSDSSSCVQLVGARFRRSTTAAGPAWVNFPYN